MTVGPVVAGLVRDLCANDASALAVGAASFWSIPPLYLFLRRMTGSPLRCALAGCGPKVWD
jgi:hypothetical protein